MIRFAPACVFILLTFISLLNPLRITPAHARVAATITELGRSGDGSCHAASANSGELALGSGLSVALWDVSDTALPVQLGGITLAGHVLDVIHDGSTIYATVSDGVNGNIVFYSLDFSTPATPTIRDSISFSGENFGFGFTRAGSFYYLRIDAVCNIISFADPDNLAAVGTTRAGNYYTAAADRLFIATSTRLYVLDNSIPSAPVELGDWPLGGSGFVGSLAVTADGNTAFVASGGIHVVDTSTPATMSELDLFTYGRFTSNLHREGDRLYADDTNGTLSILDASTPTALALIGQYEYFDGGRGFASGISTDPTRVAGTLVFISFNDGVLLADPTIPASTSRASIIPTGGGANKLVILQAPAPTRGGESTAYVVDATGSPAADLYKADFNPYVIDPNRAFAELFDPDVESLFGFADDEAGIGGVVAWFRRNESVERVELDVSQFELNTTASVATASTTEDIATNGSLIAVAQGASPIEFFDTSLSPVATLDPQGFAIGAAFGANFFVTWMLTGDFQIRVYDMPDQAGQTTPIAAFNTALFQATDVEIFGNLLFIFNTSGGCAQIYEILNLNAVQFVREICTPAGTAIRALAAAFSTPLARMSPTPLLYMAGSSNDLHVYDISDVTNPQLLDSRQTLGQIEHLAVHDDLLWAAEGPAGFATYEISVSVPVVLQIFSAHSVASGIELEWRLNIVDDAVTIDLLREDLASGITKIIVAGRPTDGSLSRYVDSSALAGREYRYTLVANLSDGFRVHSEPVLIKAPARRTQLVGNFPNPFNPSTEIKFVIATREHVRISIMDVQGRLVRTLADEIMDAGSRDVSWNGRDAAGRNVASGVYFVRLQTDSTVDSRRAVLLK